MASIVGRVDIAIAIAPSSSPIVVMSPTNHPSPSSCPCAIHRRCAPLSITVEPSSPSSSTCCRHAFHRCCCCCCCCRHAFHRRCRCCRHVAIAPSIAIAVALLSRLPLTLPPLPLHCRCRCCCCCRRTFHCRCHHCCHVAVVPSITVAIVPIIVAVPVAVAYVPSIPIAIIAIALPLFRPSRLPSRQPSPLSPLLLPLRLLLPLPSLLLHRRSAVHHHNAFHCCCRCADHCRCHRCCCFHAFHCRRSSCHCFAVAPTTTVTVALLLRRPSLPLLVDCCLLRQLFHLYSHLPPLELNAAKSQA